MVWKQRAHFEGHFQLENSIGIWGRSCNSIKESDLIEFNSQFSELRCERYLTSKWILAPEIQTNCKKFWKEKSVEPLNLEIFNSKI